MSFNYPTTTANALCEAYHDWLDDMRYRLEHTLNDKHGEPYEKGPLCDLWVGWYQHSKRNGAYAHNFAIGTDCYDTVIMPAIHGLRNILDAIKASDISFYNQRICRTIIDNTIMFEENVDTLLTTPPALTTKERIFADRIRFMQMTCTEFELHMPDEYKVVWEKMKRGAE